MPSTNCSVARLAQRRQRSLAGEKVAHARAVGSRNVGIDLERILDRFDGRLRVVVDQEGPAEQRDGGRGRASDEISTFGQRPVIAWRQQQIFPALPAIRTGAAEIDHPAEPEIVEQAERVRRRLHHHRPLGEVDIADEIDRVGICGEEQRLRVHQAGKDQDAFVVLDAGGADTVARSEDRDATQAVEIGGNATLQIELVVELVGGRLIRNAVAEFERADRGLDLIRRRKRRRNGRIGLGPGNDRDKTNQTRKQRHTKLHLQP